MIGDGLGVGRADADIDHGDAQPVRPRQVIGRHLRQMGRQRAARRACRSAWRWDDHDSPGSTKVSYSPPSRICACAEGDEFVDVALIVGEQHEALEMLGIGAGVVEQALQREVDALGAEQRQRQRLAGFGREGAVGHLIVDRAQIRHGEDGFQPRQQIGRQPRGRLFDDEGQGHAPVADADLHGHRVVFQQQLDLLPVVVGEQIGAGQGGAIGAGIGQAAIGGAAIRQQIVDADGNAEIGIAAVIGRLAVMGAGQELLEAVAHDCRDVS